MAVNYHSNTEKIAQMLRNAHNPEICKIRKDFFDAEFSFLKSRIQWKNVLVAWSGLWHDAFVLAEYNKYVTGIELIQNFVDEANKSLQSSNQKNISFVCSDFLNYTCPDKYFDAVILNMWTIGNFDDKESVVKSLFRMWKKLYFGFWIPEVNDIPLRLQMYNEEKNFRDVNFEIDWTTIREKNSWLESNCTKIEEIQNIVHNIWAKVRFYPVFKSFIVVEIF
jgi:SAM-dependent methyltransferase